jgi:N-acetylglutamate synthase-like GNAT family acetyltransferase
MKIIKSNKEDADLLTKLTIASKSYWNYEEKQISMWTKDLTISESYVLKNNVYKLVSNTTIIGYYSFFITNNIIELDNLFIKPEFIGQGNGKILILDFLEKAKEFSPKKIVLYSDPNSEVFCKKFGFTTIGQKPTSEINRFLPIMEKENNS